MNQQELQDRKQWIEGQGASIDIFYEDPAPRLQWYLPDGTPVVNLLRTDPYHLAKYRQKGWTLKPPGGDEQTGQLVEFQAPAEESSVAVAEVEEHRHRFGKTVGSVCKIRGCDIVRTKPYLRRN